MSKLIFTLEIEFQDKVVTDEEIDEVGQSVLNALVHEVNNGMGLAPEQSETFTTQISLKKFDMDTKTKKFI